MPAADDAVQLGGQLGDEMLPVPGGLGFGENLLLHLARQMRPGGDDRRSQPAHQAFLFRRIAELFVFHERHARPLAPMVEYRSGAERELWPHRTFFRGAKLNPEKSLIQGGAPWERNF